MRLVMEAPPGTEVSCTSRGQIQFKWPYPLPKKAGPVRVDIVPYDKKRQN